MSLPLVSVITVVFNGEGTIENTINSVAIQDYQNLEYVVCDGNSTDHTVDIIKKNMSVISIWVSEPDSGIYDAMNKAIALSKGEWLLFLGCDDYLAESTSISNLVDSIAEDISLVYGNVQYADGQHFLSKIDHTILIGNTLHHQASLYKKTLFDNFSYDTALKICSDYELNLLIYLQKYKVSGVNKIISIGGTGGMSAQQKNAGNEEINYIRGKHVNTIVNMLMSFLQRTWRLSYEIRKSFANIF
jgi:putative colanic acid biosynthesis glycosyltransferase